MMDWTDRHCRFFHRLLTRRSLLYTEMVTTGALLHGDVPRHLDFDAREQPLALQLGGSEPADLAHCAQLGEQWGYREINLNCGCPSERVQRGAFGACLMKEPELVRDCVRAMKDACSLPITVKHRIGVDRALDYAFVRDFVGTVAEGGVGTFIVHARAAWLQGLSPKQNREVPPLCYEFVRSLKRDYPNLSFVLNGGVTSLQAATEHLYEFDGVMLGREAYQNPWLLQQVDGLIYGDTAPAPQRHNVLAALVDYARQQARRGVHLRSISRHVLGLFNGLPGARSWRRMLSDPNQLAENNPSLLLRAADQVLLAEPIGF
jgi:tRNA-dihydrouridine synthase A